MYDDTDPCAVCGSPVELEQATLPEASSITEPVGPEAGYVGGGDETVDRRICTNPLCPTNKSGAEREA